jgi:hypothetical protein
MFNRLDSASAAVIFTGISNKEKSLSHMNSITKNLTQQVSGIGRYWGDIYFCMNFT